MTVLNHAIIRNHYASLPELQRFRELTLFKVIACRLRANHYAVFTQSQIVNDRAFRCYLVNCYLLLRIRLCWIWHCRIRNLNQAFFHIELLYQFKYFLCQHVTGARKVIQRYLYLYLSTLLLRLECYARDFGRLITQHSIRYARDFLDVMRSLLRNTINARRYLVRLNLRWRSCATRMYNVQTCLSATLSQIFISHVD